VHLSRAVSDHEVDSAEIAAVTSWQASRWPRGCKRRGRRAPRRISPEHRCRDRGERASSVHPL